MKRSMVGMLVLLFLAFLAISCGGGGAASLTLKPATASIYTNYELGTYTDVVLTATLSDGRAPTNIQWNTTDGCVAVGNFIQNTATVVCNFTCGTGTATATITAKAQGQSAKSSVTCTWE